jgi:hypothetical protein
MVFPTMTMDDFLKSKNHQLHTKSTKPSNPFNHKIEIFCDKEYKKPLEFQSNLILSLLNILGRNVEYYHNIRTRNVTIGKYKYTVFFRKSDSSLFMINLTTKKIRHVKYQFEGLITDKNVSELSEDSGTEEDSDERLAKRQKR